MFVLRLKKNVIIAVFAAILTAFGASVLIRNFSYAECSENQKQKFIKYVEFNPNFSALENAMKEDTKSESEEIKVNWIDILAYLGSIYGGDFKKYKISDLESFVKKIKNGEKIKNITEKMKTYDYYKEAYGAVLGGFLGKYKIQVNPKDSAEKIWEEHYGLRVFSPIAKTFPFCHFDDFGNSRSYGFKRRHLGHDLMSAIGTPVIAVESGIVEIAGWNQYGGWRIGIRSFDKKRYWYYAHLRKDRPFHCDLVQGKEVKAGDVIGYVGRTGYSAKENINNINENHLHLGLQLIFDESQKECDNEIWVNLYPITKLLEKNRSDVIRNNDTKEYYREFEFEELN